MCTLYPPFDDLHRSLILISVYNLSKPSPASPQPRLDQQERSVLPALDQPEAGPSLEPLATGSAWQPASGSVEQQAEPLYAAEVSYSCLLLPRFSSHFLIGDITEFLPEWIKQVCVSYGWRLGPITVRPGYMQCILTVPLGAHPGQVMRLLRSHTSEKIFEDFPHYRELNISSDFWAPGNFIRPGSSLQDEDEVNACILQTRRYQGIA